MYGRDRAPDSHSLATRPKQMACNTMGMGSVRVWATVVTCASETGPAAPGIDRNFTKPIRSGEGRCQRPPGVCESSSTPAGGGQVSSTLLAVRRRPGVDSRSCRIPLTLFQPRHARQRCIRGKVAAATAAHVACGLMTHQASPAPRVWTMCGPCGLQHCAQVTRTPQQLKNRHTPRASLRHPDTEVQACALASLADSSHRSHGTLGRHSIQRSNHNPAVAAAAAQWATAPNATTGH